MYNKNCYMKMYNSYMPMRWNQSMCMQPEKEGMTFPIYKRIIDISQAYEKRMQLYPPNIFELELVNDFSFGDNMKLSQMCTTLHNGAHIDYPSHFLPQGKNLQKFEQAYDLNIFFGPVQVVEVPYYKDKIDREFLRKIGNLPKRILFKTRNSELYKEKKFNPNYVYVDTDAANYMVRNNVRLVGIDYLSINKYGDFEQKIHKILLSQEILILECIDLSGVEPGNYILSCFPLNIIDAEAAPCRAVLIEY